MEHVRNLLHDLALAQEDRAERVAPIQQQIDLLTAEIKERTKSIDSHISDIRAHVLKHVLEHGETVKGSSLWAVYNHGRTSWDTKALTGYGAAHPEIMVFKTQGDPYVSITKAKGGK